MTYWAIAAHNIYVNILKGKIWGFNGHEDSCRGLQGSDAV
jgi:hypothetical protein